MHQRSHSIRQRARLLIRLSVVALALVPFVAQHQSPARAANSSADDAGPCIVVWYTGGNNPADKDRLEFALWDDSVFLIADGARNTLVGKVLAADQTEALARIRAAKFFDTWRDVLVPDGSSTTIYVRQGVDSAKHRWHGTLNPNFGGSLNKDATYRDFIRMWRQSRGAIDSLAPIEIASLDSKLDNSGEFRGYRPADPGRTPWRP